MAPRQLAAPVPSFPVAEWNLIRKSYLAAVDGASDVRMGILPDGSERAAFLVRMPKGRALASDLTPPKLATPTLAAEIRRLTTTGRWSHDAAYGFLLADAPAADRAWLSAPWDPAVDGYDATPNIPRPAPDTDSDAGTAPPAPEPAPVAVRVAPEGFGAANGQGEAAPGDELARARAELVRLGVLVPDSWAA